MRLDSRTLLVDIPITEISNGALIKIFSVINPDGVEHKSLISAARAELNRRYMRGLIKSYWM